MSKDRETAVALLLILIYSPFVFGNEQGKQPPRDSNEKELPKKTSVLEMATALFSRPTSVSAPTATTTCTSTTTTQSSYSHKAKKLLNQLHYYFFPPNLDFRGSEKVEATEGSATGYKVREAVAKSFGRSKATVEDSAKSAAKLAGDTMHTTADKVKQILSDQAHQEQVHPRSEAEVEL